MSKIYGLITARGGSKGLPGKNLKLLGGKPLIAWTIDAARHCAEVGRVLVSTDDESIASVAREWGADVPFMRPPELASDDASHISVVSHALEWLETDERTLPEYLLLLQPTSPFRTAGDIAATIALARKHSARAVVSVCKTHQHPYWMQTVCEDGTLANFLKPPLGYARRQNLPQVCIPNGAIYLNRSESLRQDKVFIPLGTYPYFMPEERSLDIDTPWDFHLAELILKDQNDDKTSQHR